MVKVTFEFPTLDDAIVAMGKLVGTAPVKANSTAATSAHAAVPTTSTRRGRSDKGQARGSYKNPPTINAGAAATAVDTGNGAAPAGAIGVTDTGKAAEQAATPISTVPIPVPVAPAPEPAAPAVLGSSGAASPATDVTPAAAAHTVKDLQEAIGKVFNTKGLPVALQVLSRFGANTYRDIKPEQYAEFIKHAVFVSEGGQV